MDNTHLDERYEATLRRARLVQLMLAACAFGFALPMLVLIGGILGAYAIDRLFGH